MKTEQVNKYCVIDYSRVTTPNFNNFADLNLVITSASLLFEYSSWIENTFALLGALSS